MTDQQTDNQQPAGWPKLSRGALLFVCVAIAILFVTIWIKLASKDIEVEVPIIQPPIEQSVTADQGKVAEKGKWYVSLASFRLEKDAAAMVERLAQKGVNTDYIPFIGSRKGYAWYRVRVSGFASEQAAQNELVALTRKLGIRNAWVGEELE